MIISQLTYTAEVYLYLIFREFERMIMVMHTLTLLHQSCGALLPGELFQFNSAHLFYLVLIGSFNLYFTDIHSPAP